LGRGLEGEAEVPCTFPDTAIEFAVPSSREFEEKATVFQYDGRFEMAEFGLIRKKSL
jgi:hypothetical protein